MSAPWTLAERAAALAAAERDGCELLVIGGGITGAGVARDAALRGLSTLLIERSDFAAGTSSQTSKMIHGGLRYLREGQLGVTRQSCRERDLLARLNPNLLRPLPFLLCAFERGRPPWQVRAGLWLYRALSGFEGEFSMLAPAEVARYCRDLDTRGLRAAGLYVDQQVDDARLVLETIKDARRAGAAAVSHAELIGFELDPAGRLRAARVRDRLRGSEHVLRAQHCVNAAGPSVDRVRRLAGMQPAAELRPAKGVHAVIARSRVHADAAVALQAEDGRDMFLCPFGDVHLIGTTDTFSDEIDAPVVTRADLAYVLAAANRAFPRAGLTAADVIGVYAGVRPLVADAQAETPPSSVSREHRITQDDSGLLSVAGGKLTTYRAMAEQIVDRVVAALPRARANALAPCTTAARPLRDDAFERATLARELTQRFGVAAAVRERLIEAWGGAAPALLAASPVEQRVPIAGSRYLRAEIAWAIRHECAASLCDVLERRLRVAAMVPGHGLPELAELAAVAAEAAGWSDARTQAEIDGYRAAVERRYRVQP